MKVNVVKKIVTVDVDTKKLSEEINAFEKYTNQKPYLFMNKETMEALQLIDIKDAYLISFPNGTFAEPKTVKVYQNENLEFGEVEFR